MKAILLLLSLGLIAGAAEAQLPGLRKYTPTDNAQRAALVPPAAPLGGIDATRADFAAQTGGTTVYFGVGSAILAPPATLVLSAQAAWFRRHPEVVARVEGYADSGDTRDHALAMGARRAEEARDYLLLLGVPARQVSITSWGKERPGLGRAVTVLVR
ncbi:MAG TPA: OmpA family protein [Sphingomicrobium sp.]|nr:OmpA family protein [Sphingomicrobium sp.]